jgi:hypothetical protein
MRSGYQEGVFQMESERRDVQGNRMKNQDRLPATDIG